MHSLNNYIAQTFKAACMAELEALKPGNVHIFADGHGMTIHDFINSAEAVSQVIAQPDLSLGQRILLSVQATHKTVGCNTNLGIILLCTPMIHAALMANNHDFYTNLAYVLHHTTVDDAQQTFSAIALAKPAGLGDTAKHSVLEPADCNLRQAMQMAAHRDLIAAQYCNQFDAIFKVGLPLLKQSNQVNQAWLTTQLYLTLMATFADSHIDRKYGAKIAADIQLQASQHLTIFNLSANPKLYQSKLLAWDNQLKQMHINPGTSADLTVATLFAYALND